MPKAGTTAPTLPLDPIEAIARTQADLEEFNGGDGTGTFNDTVFADMIGCSTRALIRWRKNEGRIPWQSADVAAVSLGLHPALVWGDEWWDLDAEYVAMEMAREAEATLDAVAG